MHVCVRAHVCVHVCQRWRVGGCLGGVDQLKRLGFIKAESF